MVQVLNSELGSPWGRLGAGVGQGLAEQLPKEVDRYRLSSGLKKLEKDSSTMTPFQMASGLATLPGGEGKDLSHLQGILQNQVAAKQANERYQNRGIGNIGNGFNGQGKLNNEKVGSQSSEQYKKKYGTQPTSLISPEDVKREQQPRPTLPYDELYRQGLEYYNNSPGAYPSIEKGIERAEKDLATEQGLWDAEQGAKVRREDSESKALNNFETKLGKAGIDVLQDLPNSFNKFQDQVIQKVAEGVPETRAASEVLQPAKRLAEARGKVLDSSVIPFIGSPGSWANNLKSSMEAYKENNELETAKQDLMNYQYMGKDLASDIAFPLQGNLNKIFKTMPESDFLLKRYRKNPFMPFGEGRQPPPKIEKLVNSIVKDFGENDSVDTIGYKTFEKGYDDNAVIERLKAHPDFRKKLNSRQLQELDGYYPVNLSLRDILYLEMNGKK